MLGLPRLPGNKNDPQNFWSRYRMGPQFVNAKLVQITIITIVYDMQITIYF